LNPVYWHPFDDDESFTLNEITNPGSLLMNDGVAFGNKEIVKMHKKVMVRHSCSQRLCTSFFYRHHFKNIIDITMEIDHRLKYNCFLDMIMPLLGIQDKKTWKEYEERLLMGYQQNGNYFVYDKPRGALPQGQFYLI
jgi:hypothetical protein